MHYSDGSDHVYIYLLKGESCLNKNNILEIASSVSGRFA
jgi:hypothetical protein